MLIGTLLNCDLVDAYVRASALSTDDATIRLVFVTFAWARNTTIS